MVKDADFLANHQRRVCNLSYTGPISAFKNVFQCRFVQNFDPFPAHNVIKIDVQGAEPRVLRGARRLLESGETTYVFMELWPKGLKEDGSSLGELIHLCTDSGLAPVDEALAPVEWKPIEDRFGAEGDELVLNVLLAKRLA